MAPEVAVVGLCDVLMEAGQEHMALSLLAEAEESGLLSLWKTKRKERLSFGAGVSMGVRCSSGGFSCDFSGFRWFCG